MIAKQRRKFGEIEKLVCRGIEMGEVLNYIATILMKRADMNRNATPLIYQHTEGESKLSTDIFVSDANLFYYFIKLR